MKFVIPSCPNMSKQKNKHMLVVLTFDVSYVMFVFIVLPSCILDDVNNACVIICCLNCFLEECIQTHVNNCRTYVANSCQSPKPLSSMTAAAATPTGRMGQCISHHPSGRVE